MPPYTGTNDVVGMFDSIAHRYDLLNTLFSFGLDSRWRKEAAHLVAGSRPLRVLDLAAGTGALAKVIARKTRRPIVAVDASKQMLDLLQAKRGRSPQLLPVRADAMRLPFKEETFDAVAMAFGLRNMPSLPGSLTEMRRVLRPGGLIALLELTTPSSPLIKAVYPIYMKYYIRWAGRLLSHSRDAYEHLRLTIEQFPPNGEIVQILRSAGFEGASYRTLTSGIVTLFSARAGRRPEW